MSEAFGGCCVYNEGARHDVGKSRRAELADRRAPTRWPSPISATQELIDAALKSLPAVARRRARAFPRGQDPSLAVVGERDSRRPAGARRDDQSPARAEEASGPGGGRRLSVRLDAERPAQFLRCRDRHHRHRDDASCAARAAQAQGKPVSDKIDRDYFENYRGLGPYQRGLEPVHRSGLSHDADRDRLEAGQAATSCWSRAPPAANWSARCASAASMPVGIENNRAHPRQDAEGAEEVQQARLGRRMPFEDDEFDFVFETSLCHVAGQARAAGDSRAATAW